MARDPVGELHECRSRMSRPLAESPDRAECRVDSRPMDAHGHGAIEVDAAGHDAITAKPRARCGFAGEQRFIGAGRAFDDLAVGRERLPGANQQQVAGREPADRNLHMFAVLQPGCRIRQQRRHGRAAIDGSMSCPHLEVAGDGQEEHEHRDRVVPDRGPAGKSGVHGRNVGTADSDRDRDVHAGTPGAKAAQRAGEERSPGVEDDRGRHEERNQTQETLHVRVDALEFAGVERDGEHHDLHHAERCDEQALQRGSLLDPLGLLAAVRCQGLWLVAEIGNDRQHAAQADHLRIPANAQAMRHRADVDIADCIHLAECGIDEPGARGTIHAPDVDACFCGFATAGRESGKHVLAVEHLPFAGVLRRPDDSRFRSLA